MKKIIKCFSFVIISLLFVFLTSNTNVDAAYNRDSNKLSVAVSKESVEISVAYQRGLDTTYPEYYWCKISEGEDASKVINDATCNPEGNAVNYVNASGNANVNFISVADSNSADANLTRYKFTIAKENDHVLNTLAERTNGNENNVTKYVLLVRADFCTVRYVDGETYSGCKSVDDTKWARLEVDLMELKNNSKLGSTETPDEEINEMMDKIKDIVYNVVLPVIWGVLGLFMVVKGSLLGVQIVKAADEPQVRQEKIGSLKWLVIGCAIAFAASGVVAVVFGFFSGAFK